MPCRVSRLDAVVISPEDATYLADALGLFETLANASGSRTTPRLNALRAELASAARVSRIGVDARVSGAATETEQNYGRDYLDTADAARVLGCTAGNARDLARRGIVPGIRVGGRWLLETSAVHARAAGW